MNYDEQIRRLQMQINDLRTRMGSMSNSYGRDLLKADRNYYVRTDGNATIMYAQTAMTATTG